MRLLGRGVGHLERRAPRECHTAEAPGQRYRRTKVTQQQRKVSRAGPWRGLPRASRAHRLVLLTETSDTQGLLENQGPLILKADYEIDV